MRSAFPIPPPITSEAVWTAPGQEDGAGTNADFGPVESRATEGAGHRAVAEDAVDGAVGHAVIVDAPVGHVVAMLEELPEGEEEREEHDEAERPRRRQRPPAGRQRAAADAGADQEPDQTLAEPRARRRLARALAVPGPLLTTREDCSARTPSSDSATNRMSSGSK